MAISFRVYQHETDYQKVSEFLIKHHQPGNLDGNWLEPAWEYMHFHPALDSDSLGKIGIWEKDDTTVAVVHYEWHLGEAFFQFHPDHRNLRSEMLDYAENQLTGVSKKDGRRYLCAYVNDNDAEFTDLVRNRGYQMHPDETRPLYRFEITSPFQSIRLPRGYHLTSLAEDCDWEKLHRVMWRGFDHGDDPPINAEELESRRKMFMTPKARLDLKIAVVAPSGEFSAFCGMFFEPAGKFAYVEPVATVPEHRRLGLGKAAVLEGIRRCADLGAETAYVGSDQPFYQAIGFHKVFNSECWVKYFS